MKTLVNVIIFLLVFLMHSSCVKEINIGIQHEPQYIVYGSMSNLKQAVSVSIKKSVPVNSVEKTLTVNNASVSLFSSQEGSDPVLVTDDFINNDGVYISRQQILGIIGRSYWIEIVLDNGNIIVSTKEQMRNVVPIKRLEYLSFFEVEVAFSDPENERNYYLLESEFFSNGELFYKSFVVSDDVIFNGNDEVKLKLDIFYKPNGDTEMLNVLLSNINYSSYQFHLNRSKQKENNENNVPNEEYNGDPGPLFANPPVSLFGNIKSKNGNKVLGNFTVNGSYIREF